MKRTRRAVALLLGSLACVAWHAAGAQGASSAKLAALGATPELGKVSSHLREARRLAARGVSTREIRSLRPELHIEEAGAEVEVRLDALDPATVEALRAAGLETTHVSYRHARVVGFVPLDRLAELAAVPGVAVIHPQYGAQLWTGSVDNQADVSIRADLTRAQLGVDGTGVTVGVLSDSFHDVIGGTISGSGCSRTLSGSTSQLSGDLPAAMTVLDSGPGSLSDEGAAMAELIHDLAPGAALSFHTAFNSIADFADGILDLRDCGAHVIVDDVIYFAEPMFQDGPIAQAAQEVADGGVAYFSSAGNNGTFGVDQTFADFSAADDTAFPPTGNDFHDFGAGDRFATVTLPAGCGIRAVLQWDDPFDGTLGPGAANDLDLYLCTSTAVADCTFASTNLQGCSFGPGMQSGDALEILGPITNGGGSPVTAHLAVEHFCGDQDQRFRIAIYGAGCSLSSFTFQAGIFERAQTYGHAAAAGANAVAAVFYGEIDTGGAVTAPLGQIDVEPFSSLGGNLPFFFDGSGNPLAGAPVTRFKPEMAAPDGTNTTFFGSDIAFDADAHPNFFGTSAAAPHAAAVAALMKSASPDLTPAGVRQVLQAAAVDVEAAGTDTLSGAGLVDALDATQTVAPSGDGCIDLLALSAQTISGAQTFRACEEIRAGMGLVVAPTGDLSFRAGERIVLEDGFSVLSGASFIAEIDPSL